MLVIAPHRGRETTACANLQENQTSASAARPRCKPTGETLQEELRFAVVFRCVTGQLKTWFQLQVQDGTSYANLREHTVRYDKATLKWTDATCLAFEPSHATVPMDVDRIEKRKKGKGKPKGMNNKGKQTKGDSKGDGKVEFQSSKGHGSQQQGGKQNPGFSGNGTKQDTNKQVANKACRTKLQANKVTKVKAKHVTLVVELGI